MNTTQVSKSSSPFVALIYVDLDDFEEINRKYGSLIGDTLLSSIQTRLKFVSTKVFNVSHVKSDEYCVGLRGLDSLDELRRICTAVLNAIAKALSFGNQVVSTTGSLGVCSAPEGTDVLTLREQAHKELYRAKIDGKNTYSLNHGVLVPDIDTPFSSSELRKALDENQFELYYQPLVDLKTNQLTSLEALIRWNHPQKGLLSAGQFLQHVDEAFVSLELGAWVFEQALAQLSCWNAAGQKRHISINISPSQLECHDLCRSLSELRDNYADVSPTQLTFEILESGLFKDTRHAHGQMEECKAMGFTFALDDFGSGFSSFTNLKNLPVEYLKIDMNFISDMFEASSSLSIIEAILRLASALQLRVVAEGVENQDQYDVLAQLGCDEVQGYFVGRPMQASMLQDWCAECLPQLPRTRYRDLTSSERSILVSVIDHQNNIKRAKQAVLSENPDHRHSTADKCTLGSWLNSGRDSRVYMGGHLQDLRELYAEVHDCIDQLAHVKAIDDDAAVKNSLARLESTNHSLVSGLLRNTNITYSVCPVG